jgi:hypothetical protein
VVTRTSKILIGLAAALLPSAASARATDSAQGVVHRGRPVQITFAEPVGNADYPTSLANAIHMAVAAHPRVRGFRVRVSSPWIRGYPQLGFSRASRTTSAHSARRRWATRNSMRVRPLVRDEFSMPA